MTINDELLNDLLQKAQESPRKRMHFDLRTTPNDQSRRMLNAILPESVLPIHRHSHETETIAILKGKAKEVFYDDDGNIIEEVVLDPSLGNHGIHVPKGQWHTIKAITPCVIMEAMNGPYAPIPPEDFL